ncbi:MAG TPA: sigma-E factor regulatory protein RseB domain-containing protein [Armatimonadota bacterium]|jgi:negative regulator of sigma E activity|nr:sigma-E factor regulatory protein RseB domain-containing protein [Armatimonadota bacterium]
MRNKAVFAALTVAVLVFSGWIAFRPAAVDGTAELIRAYKAAQTLNYSGSVVTTINYCNNQLRSSSNVCCDGTAERIEYTSGPLKGKIVATRRKTGDVSDATLDLMLENYSAKLTGRDNVAGRDVNVVELTPKHKGNPSKRLWIDSETGLVLRSEDYSFDGSLRTKTVFTKVSYSRQDNQAKGNTDVLPVQFVKKMDKPDVEKAVGVKVSMPEYVPAGYVLDGISVHSCECSCSHKAAHIRYTNGINSISIFETPDSHTCGALDCGSLCPKDGGCEIRNACQARVALASSGGKNVIVVTDMPEQEIARITNSIR